MSCVSMGDAMYHSRPKKLMEDYMRYCIYIPLRQIVEVTYAQS